MPDSATSGDPPALTDRDPTVARSNAGEADLQHVDATIPDTRRDTVTGGTCVRTDASAERAYRDRMRSLPLFADCTDEEIDLLDGMLTEVSVPSGREVIHEGAVGREFAVVVEGTASVTRGGEELARLRPGSFFGELSLLEGDLRSTSVTSLTPMRIYVFDRGQFQTALHDLPHVASQIRSVGQERLSANAARGTTDGESRPST